MKKGLLIAVMVAVASLKANAQLHKNQNKDHSAKYDQSKDRFARNDESKDHFAEVELSADQRASVDSIKKVYDEKRDAVKKDPSLSKQQRQRKMQDIREEEIAASNPFLTRKQKKELKQSKGKKKKED